MNRMMIVASLAAMVMLGFAASPLFAAQQDTADLNATGAMDEQTATLHEGSEDVAGWNEEEGTSDNLAESARAISSVAADLDTMEQGSDQAVEFDDDTDPDSPYTM